jgi:hypothetical protein
LKFFFLYIFFIQIFSINVSNEFKTQIENLLIFFFEHSVIHNLSNLKILSNFILYIKTITFLYKILSIFYVYSISFLFHIKQTKKESLFKQFFFEFIFV